MTNPKDATLNELATVCVTTTLGLLSISAPRSREEVDTFVSLASKLTASAITTWLEAQSESAESELSRVLHK